MPSAQGPKSCPLPPPPQGLISEFLTTVMRCSRCSGGGPLTSETVLDLAVAVAAAAPSRLPRELFLAMMDAAQG